MTACAKCKGTGSVGGLTYNGPEVVPCPECFPRCPECGDACPRAEMVADDAGNLACGMCAEALGDRCDYEGGSVRAALGTGGRP